MYNIKTRNFNCNKTILWMLSLSLRTGAIRGDNYNDGDGKFLLETRSASKAWVVWIYFMALRPFSGGWTYIIRPKYDGDLSGYKSIY